MFDFWQLTENQSTKVDFHVIVPANTIALLYILLG